MFEVIKRRDAAERGLKLFFSGRPCFRGHLSPRYVSCGACLECGRESAKTYAVKAREAKKFRRDAVARQLIPLSFEVHPDDVAELTAFADAQRIMRGLPATTPAVQAPKFQPMSDAEVFAARCRISGTAFVLAEYRRTGRPIPEEVPQFEAPPSDKGNYWPTHDPK